jgi:uridylate kinase
MYKYHVIELGGSIISKEDENGKLYNDHSGADFIKSVLKEQSSDFGAILIVGGGRRAAQYIKKQEPLVRKTLGIDPTTSIDNLSFLESRILRHSLDYFGIKATHENSAAFIQALKDVGVKKVCPEVLTHPFRPLPTRGGKKYQVYVAGGFKPGATTDAVAAYFAEATQALKVYKISNFDYMKDCPVWKFDPKKIETYPDLHKTTFDHVASLVGDKNEMIPGGSYPLDPKAVSLYQQFIKQDHLKDIQLYVGALEQLPKMLKDDPFIGTIITR